MIYDYILKTFEKGEPIFLSELPCSSVDYLRQEMKKLTDDGKLERIFNGVYILPYTTILGTKGRLSIGKYIEKKYLFSGGRATGYITGLQLANTFGFTTQNPACYEIRSNEATTKQRKLIIDGNTIMVYQPVAEITEENKSALQFLDLMLTIDRYSEVSRQEQKRQIKKYLDIANPDFKAVKKYLSSYPDRVYRNIYEGGLMSELV